MHYLSTRDRTLHFTAAEAIKQGLSRDGGLFLPEMLPALSALYVGLGGIWNFPLVEQVAGTISCVTVFLGALLGISTAQYHKEAKNDG